MSELEKEQEINNELGAPDFSSIIDDEEEITAESLGVNNAKARKGLKPSMAIEKFMPLMFNFIASRKGEHWVLLDEEVEEFAEAFDDCVAYYFPDNPILPPWAMLAFSSAGIFLPRLIIDSLSDEQKEEVQKELSKLPENPEKALDEKQAAEIIGQGTVLKPKAVING